MRSLRLVLRLVLLSCLGAAALHAQAPSASSRSARVFLESLPGRSAEVAQAASNAGGRVHHEFASLNAVAVTLPAAAVDALSRHPLVVAVEEDPVRRLLATTEIVPYGVAKVNAPAVHAGGATGAGIKVGIIDSGISFDHEDFAELKAAGKISGGGLATWKNDLDGHGTHVAGTIAAQVNSKGVIGVSPAVSLHIVRVFDDTGAWTYASDLLRAAQLCRDAGAKIINMSLGGGTKSRYEERGLADLYNVNGILLIAAAGNDGNTQFSYPASYDTVISVAAVDAGENVADFSQRNSQVELAAPGVDVLSAAPFVQTNTVQANGSLYSGEHIENAGYGSLTAPLVDGGRAATTSAAWAGKVVLVERGDISFADKVKNVQDSGGLAAIIYNNVAGSFSGTLGDVPSSLPALSLSREDGLALLAAVGANVTVTCTAPAVATNGYQYMSGTSMATPHVSGVAALVWSAAPTKTNKEIRAVLASTAKDLLPAGRDTATGYGLVDAKKAWEAVGGGASTGGGGGGTTDNTAPTLASGPTTTANARNGNFTIAFTTSEPATSQLRITSPVTAAGSISTLTLNHSYSFRGSKGVTYTYEITVTDAAGNAANFGPFTHKN